MYVAAGEFMKAVDIMGENGWTDRYCAISCTCKLKAKYQGNLIFSYVMKINCHTD